jgi:hypothetical protein
MLDRLTRQKSAQASSLLVLKLKHLALSAGFDVDDQAILDMVRSRWKITKSDVNGGIDANAQRAESLKTVTFENNLLDPSDRIDTRSSIARDSR